jgi:hypothetical protein
LAAGSPRDGRISAVRRFFCLFVTFDFLFTALMWIICLVVIKTSGENIQEMLIDQIVHYTIHGSLFDIVVMLTLSQLSFKLSLLTSYYKFNF